MQRIAITGSSGYLGQKLVAELVGAGKQVLGIDVKPGNGEPPPSQFCQADIRDPSIGILVSEFSPDTIIHCAFVLRPLRDTKEMLDINILGTMNLLDITKTVAPARFLFVSSATAYGAWPDNPLPIPDDWKPRRDLEYGYAQQKADLEERVSEFASSLPKTAVSWVRPSLIGGPCMDNFLSRFIFGSPIFWMLDGADHPLQFVHEDDVVRAIIAILQANARGSFNLAPPNWTMTSEIAQQMKRPKVPIPFSIAKIVTRLCWMTRLWLVETPPSILRFARHPWVVCPSRLTDEIRFEFRFTSNETMALTVKDQTYKRIAASRSRERKG